MSQIARALKDQPMGRVFVLETAVVDLPNIPIRLRSHFLNFIAMHFLSFRLKSLHLIPYCYN